MVAVDILKKYPFFFGGGGNNQAILSLNFLNFSEIYLSKRAHSIEINPSRQTKVNCRLIGNWNVFNSSYWRGIEKTKMFWISDISPWTRQKKVKFTFWHLLERLCDLVASLVLILRTCMRKANIFGLYHIRY